MGKLRKWTAHSINELCRLYREGASYEEIANSLGCNLSAVKNKTQELIKGGKLECRIKIRAYKKQCDNGASNKLPMTDGEIRSSYRMAKDQESQIVILSQLNDCTVNRIKEILFEGESDMYVSPFALGVLATLAVEAIALIIYGMICASNDDNNK